jgi:hypothetical protein
MVAGPVSKRTESLSGDVTARDAIHKKLFHKKLVLF